MARKSKKPNVGDPVVWNTDGATGAIVEVYGYDEKYGWDVCVFTDEDDEDDDENMAYMPEDVRVIPLRKAIHRYFGV